MFAAPALTPWKARSEGALPRNPGFRQYFYNKNSLNYLTDYKQFYMDLNKANEENSATWKSLYTFNQVYGTSRLEARQVHLAKETFRNYASDNFHKFYEYYNVGFKDPYTPCGCECKEGLICAIENFDETAYNACVEDAPCSASALETIPMLVLCAVAFLSKFH
jgi:sphingomyelin phosphodiesterase acid-like 3